MYSLVWSVGITTMGCGGHELKMWESLLANGDCVTLAVEGLEVKQHYEESYVTGCAKPAAPNT